MDGDGESQDVVSYESPKTDNNDRRDIINAARNMDGVNKRKWIEKINTNGITAPLVTHLGDAKQWFKEGLSSENQTNLLRPIDVRDEKMHKSLKYNKRFSKT